MLSAKWVADQVGDDGTILACDGDLGNYYKCVYPLRLAGYTHKASLTLKKIMSLHYTKEGDLHNPSGDKTSGSYTSKYCQVYPNGWVFLGAYMTGQYDIAGKLMKGILDLYYDDELGTIRSVCNPRTDLFDINSAAMAVEMFCLTDMDKAKRAADFIIRHIDNQPDPKNLYYSIIKKPFEYLTGPEFENATYSVVDLNGEKQAYWFLGLPCAAMIHLYQKTSDKLYFNQAVRLFDIYLSCGEPGFNAPGSGKSFWAASMLYRLTGEEKYKNACLKVMDYFISMQQPDGTFLLPGMKPEEAVPKFQFDVAPEYARWFLEVASELAAAE